MEIGFLAGARFYQGIQRSKIGAMLKRLTSGHTVRMNEVGLNN